MDFSNTEYQLYPEIEPHATGMLEVDDTHRIYWEVSGNPEGMPVLFVHGGPGAGAASTHRRFFDPEHYRIVIFDQRGSGRSKPFAEITDNTTQHLIVDMEKLRKFLGIDRWVLFGGSWGSSLSLAYGIEHAERVVGFVLRGIFLCSQPELDWFLDGIKVVFPENWRKFAEFLPPEERGELLRAYHARLTHPDAEIHLPAAKAWANFEGACSTLLLNPHNVAGLNSGRAALALARIEAHYFVNDMFLPENFFFDQLDHIKSLPAVIVQGRYDMVCPIHTADALARAWPGATYIIIPDAGHSAMESGVRSALVGATDKLKNGI